ncbi:uncharacterized protein B0I36DRAFT_313611 [Microdochium trichocladiopsis]|uniref:Uncharacterized protein n=1 Tax=Microdochium trichocladiopsis TaxID=1682393 RepID=A0A9P9BU98_9PEZI|nr:uncharacterized protein B0I36DRAFT_313611 [Microdochium trichocladiopsis]KAH7037244.1 hypothetical protein B0I36DRAFT_313611 [Microdochium trichocladiopsis]
MGVECVAEIVAAVGENALDRRPVRTGIRPSRLLLLETKVGGVLRRSRGEAIVLLIRTV